MKNKMGKSTNARNRRRKTRRYMEQRGLCWYCQEKMILSFRAHGGNQPKRLATMEHLDDKYSGKRGKRQGEIRIVIACKECNESKGRKRTSDRPIYELWKRSSRMSVEFYFFNKEKTQSKGK